MFGKLNDIMERLGSIKLWMIDINEKLAAIQNELSEHNKLMQAAQPIYKQAIYNEMERERKAKARKNKENGKVEEAVTNEAV